MVFRYCVVSLAVWILVTHLISNDIAVSHRQCVKWVRLIIEANEILHIHTIDVWTKPARLIWFLCFLKLVLDFLHIFELVVTANSFNALCIFPCLVSTEHCIPVLCNVEIITTDCRNWYRWHCLFKWHVESRIFCIIIIINVAKIHSLVKRFIGQYRINHLDKKRYNCRVSDQWTTASDCSLVLFIPAVVDLIRCLGASRIEVGEEWTRFCLLWH